MARKATIKLRQDTYENFEADASGDGILQGEVVYLTDKKALVVGDGVNGVAGHPTIRPVANYYDTNTDGWTVTKDNNGIERKFWKDDFSVDSSENWSLETGSVTVDTTNKKMVVSGIPVGGYYYLKPTIPVPYGRKISYVCNIDPSGTNNAAYRYLNLYLGNVHVASFFRTNNATGTSCALSPSIIPADQVVWNGVPYNPGMKVEVEIGATTAKLWINGVLKNSGTLKSGVDLSGEFNFRLRVSEGKSVPFELLDVTVLPSESYADPFTSDTVSGATGRYQPVLGTVAYDDANKRMNVTTATGANGKASGRLKSYKFCEGSQIYDVLLPTGADGDFICMVTHATNGAMDNGIGVGLQSDGAGNWNLATLSGTTVTEGADSGLDDADVARIEIEKDLSGAYWYYIYDAAGTKPTTATGKLFTTLTEGYTGWYANGNSKTYAIDNISIRAESIVGRTNVELTEEVFNSVTGEMETRTYFKPIHRGSMLETYFDGTQEVVGTTFIDDCQWNRSAEWVNVYTPTWDTVNGKITLNQASEGIFTKDRFGDGYISFRVKFGANLSASRMSLKLCSVERNFSETGVTTYYLHTTETGGLVLYKIISGVFTTLDPYIATIVINTEYKIEVLKVGSTINVYVDGALKKTVTDPSLTSGYIGFGCWVSSLEYRDIQIIAASPDATNGIAACIPPIGGGARYGVQEGASIEFTNKALRGDYDFTTCVKTTVTGETPYYEMFFKNTTDDSAIAADSTTLKNVEPLLATYTDFEQALNLKYADRDDTISVQVRRHTSAPDEVNTSAYIDFMAVVPTKEVI